MIRLTGTEGTSEYEAGCSIRDALKAYWPKLEDSPAYEENVLIACGVKLAGYRIQDFDVVLCAKLRTGRKFVPTHPLRAQDGAIIEKQAVAVSNLMVAIEVKDHDAAGVRLLTGNILVRYMRGTEKWSNATEQNIDQVHALKQYFLDQKINMYVRRLLIMRGLDKIEVEGAAPRKFNGAEFLTEIAATAPIMGGRDPYMSSCDTAAITDAQQARIFYELKPTSLDRQRMDRIVSKHGLSDEWFGTLGQKLLSLRGRGGTGKTVLLLQAAWRAYDEEGVRTLLLTYNLALVADIRRTMALMNIPGSAPESGITVDSVMSIILAWLKHFDIMTELELFDLTKYAANCAAALEYLRSGAVTTDDIERIKEAAPEKFSFDYILADEGQDWPQDEAEILKQLYGSKRIATADGVDQLIRGKKCDWFKGVAEEDRKLVKLRRCLRMKANLAAFANGIAREAKINWDTEPNPDAAGGRIFILPGSYAAHEDFQTNIVAEAKEAGNELIDLLVCVPPSDVARYSEGRRSGLAQVLASHGYDVWDATDRDIRRDFARGTDTLRVVQYASCRGLEGWTVIAEGLDQYWQDCFDQCMKSDPGANADLFRSPEDAARSDAWHRLLIPLTRSIDTLVITINDPASEAAKILLKCARRFRDFVDICES